MDTQSLSVICTGIPQLYFVQERFQFFDIDSFHDIFIDKIAFQAAKASFFAQKSSQGRHTS